MGDKVKVLTIDGLGYYHTKVKKAIEDAKPKYTNAEPIVTPIGGVKAGETFDNVSIPDMLTKILYPYTLPAISGMTAVAAGGVFEKGTAVSVTSMSVTVGKKSSALSKVEFLLQNTVVDTITTGLPETGTAVIKSTKTLTINTNGILYAKVYDSETTQGVSTVTGPSYNFVDPYFYGSVADGTELTSEAINALTKRIETKGKKVYTFNPNNERPVFAYPKSYGKLKIINDPNGFDVTDTFDVKEVTVTVKSGQVDYYVYELANVTTVDNFNFSFTY